MTYWFSLSVLGKRLLPRLNGLVSAAYFGFTPLDSDFICRALSSLPMVFDTQAVDFERCLKIEMLSNVHQNVRI